MVKITALEEPLLKAPEHELVAAAQHCTPEQVAHIKKAAHEVWRPGLNRDVDFCGERCEVWAAGQGRDVDIKTPSGAAIGCKTWQFTSLVGNLDTHSQAQFCTGASKQLCRIVRIPQTSLQHFGSYTILERNHRARRHIQSHSDFGAKISCKREPE